MGVMRGCVVSVVLVIASMTPAFAQGARGTGRISGRVVSAETGAPLPGASLFLQANTGPSQPPRTTFADVDGAFEFAGLPAGDYVLASSKGGYFIRPLTMLARPSALTITLRDGRAADPVTISMKRGGAITGRVVDGFGEPVAGVRVEALRVRHGSDGSRTMIPVGTSDTTDDLGQFRVYGLPSGDFIVGTGSMFGVALTSTPAVREIPTYYPATTNIAEAQVVSLGPGQEAGAQITLVRARPGAITGTAQTSAGQPAAGMAVTLRSSSSSPLSFRSPATVSADGTFEIADVAPGDYWVDVGPAVADRRAERGSARASVTPDEAADVRVVTMPRTTIRGTLVFEGEPPERFQVQAELPAGSIAGVLDPDGGFELNGVSGRALFAPTNPGWTATSVLVDGREVVDEPVDFTGTGLVTGVRMTVVNRETVFAGTVVDAQGRPMPDHLVVLLRTDREADDLRLTMRTKRTGENGRFDMRGMRPGSYVAGVVGEIEDGDEYSPDFRERLRQVGRPVTLDLIEGVVLDLTPTPGL